MDLERSMHLTFKLFIVHTCILENNQKLFLWCCESRADILQLRQKGHLTDPSLLLPVKPYYSVMQFQKAQQIKSTRNMSREIWLKQPSRAARYKCASIRTKNSPENALLQTGEGERQLTRIFQKIISVSNWMGNYVSSVVRQFGGRWSNSTSEKVNAVSNCNHLTSSTEVKLAH